MQRQTDTATAIHGWSWYCDNDPDQEYDPADYLPCETCDGILAALDQDEGRGATETVIIYGEVDDRFHFCPTCAREARTYYHP